MNFVTRFRHPRSQEDISYYVADLGTPTMFPQAAARLYFVVRRLQLTRVGPTMRGEVLSEAEAEDRIADLREASDWEEMDTSFE
ncbi:MAG: hypothetical protein EHM35_04025 [Planctomycetaceae bacterium]|nr:MAG: hypothetical protein EHM35_04025 [Planctomycetaceae bacterium]